jgi:DNA repair protein RadD
MLKLRHYQTRIVDGVRNAYLQGMRAPLAVAPTGAGKTVIFSYIAQTTAARSKRVLILVHRVELLRQTSEKLRDMGVDHGIINPLYTPDYRKPVQVASVQTLINRMALLQQPDLIVVDEAHHATAGTWRKIVSYYSQARILGVTATPCRADGAGLGAAAGGIFDELVLGPTVAELIAEGFLVKPIIYAPSQQLDFSDVRMKRGDYDKQEIEARVDKPTITGDVIGHYQRICPGTPAVAFCISVNHALHVAEEFRKAGYRAYAVDGGMDDDTRKRILGGLGNGSVDVVCSCDLISEGTDIPAIGCAILLRPTKSTGLYIQQVGRALRTLDGKEHAIILDHVGNVITHGMPEEDREWTLDGEKRRKKGKKDEEKSIRVKQCDKCYAMHAPAPSCPVCGHTYEVEAGTIQQVDGELRQITALDAMNLKRQRIREEAQAKTLEELETIAKARGYKPGWAKHKYAARQQKKAV